MNNVLRKLFAATTTIILVACGGGGSSSPAPAPTNRSPDAAPEADPARPGDGHQSWQCGD